MPGPRLLLFLLLTLLPFGAVAAPLSVDFIHEADGRPLSIDSLRYKTDSGETVSISRLDWIASGFVLGTADGRQIEVPGKFLYIPGRGAGLSLGEVPGGEKITSLSFCVGPDAETNHADPVKFGPQHPLNPAVASLHWDWQGGFIFMALEGHWRAAKETAENVPGVGGYSYHYARDINRMRVTLPITPGLEVRNESRLVVALDPVKLLDGISIAKEGRSTHSQEADPLTRLLRANLPGAFRLAGVELGGVPTAENAPKPIDLPPRAQPHPISLPRHIPIPRLPSDNPLLAARVALGKELFEEKLLSRTGEISCASCHQADHAFSDPRRASLGVDGLPGRRHSMPLLNLAWKDAFFWDGRATTLREQVLIPIQDPLEMDETLENVAEKLWQTEKYPALFAEAFGSGDINAKNIGLALENFLLTLLSLDSKFDRVMKGQEQFSDQEKRGFELFFTEFEPRMGKRGADCFHCHGGPLFTDHAFHNNGLPPTEDGGREEVTGKRSDRDKFMTPSLRNVALTAPYMHDGRMKTLEEVMRHYNHGFGPNPNLDPNLAKHPPEGIQLSEAEQRAVIAFLKTLNDPAFEKKR
jgi:cytochrome c peroxidase